MYEGDKEIVYVYDLHTDIESGNLEVLGDIGEGTIKTFELERIKTPYKGKILGSVPGYPNWYNDIEGLQSVSVFRPSGLSQL